MSLLSLVADRVSVRVVASVALVPAAAVTVAALGGIRFPGVLLGAWLLLVGLLVGVLLVDREDRPTIALIIAAAMTLRLTLGAVLLTFFHTAVFTAFDDAQRYVDIGAEIANGWRTGHPIDLFAEYALSVAAYYHVVAAIDYLGADVAALLCFNAAAVAATAGVVYRLGAALQATRRERILAVAVASFAPSVLFWSAIPLKDAAITLVFFSGILAAITVAERRSPAALAVLVASVIIMTGLRLYATLFITGATVVALVLFRMPRRMPLWSATVLLLVAAAQLWTLQTPVGREVTLTATDPNEIQRQRDIYNGSSGASAVPTASEAPSAAPSAPLFFIGPHCPSSSERSAIAVTSLLPNAPAEPGADRLERYLDLLLHEPMFVVQFFALPIPFVTCGALANLAAPEMILWYLGLPVAVAGLLILYRRRPDATLIVGVLTLGMAVVYGTIVSNPGSLLRYRAQTIVLLAIPLAVGLVAAWRRLRERYAPTRAERV